MVTTRGADRRSMSPEKTQPAAEKATPHKPASTRSTRHTSPSKRTRRSASPTKPKPKATPSKLRKKMEKATLEPPNALQPVSELNASEDGTDDSDRAASKEEEVPAITLSRIRGRLQKKRSFDEVAEENEEEEVVRNGSKHVRKRSRETVEDDTNNMEVPVADEPCVPEEVKDIEEAGTEEIMANTDYTAADKVNDPTLTPPPEEEDAGKGPISSSTDIATAIVAPLTPPKTTESPTNGLTSAQTSPRSKRTREMFDDDHKSEYVETPTEPAKNIDATATAEMSPAVEVAEPELKKRASEKPSAEEAIMDAPEFAAREPAVLSGFANTSTDSPFQTLTNSKSPPPLKSEPLPGTSANAFASSGFAALATSSTSGFGSLGAATTSSPFATATAASTSTFGSFGTVVTADASKLTAPVPGLSSFATPGAATSPSPFASAPGSTGFGGVPAGFGGLPSSGSGFGGGFSGGFGGGFGGFGGPKSLSSFASPGSASSFGASKPAKAFGAPAEDDDEDNDVNDEDDDQEAGGIGEGDGHTDERFYHQEVETGEESESTTYRQRAKLYMSIDKQWKERGVGDLKINIKPDNDGRTTARFLMRADGVHRIVLNSPILKETIVQDPAGGAPLGKHAIFLGFVEGKPTLMQVKMRGGVQTNELCDAVKRVQKELS